MQTADNIVAMYAESDIIQAALLVMEKRVLTTEYFNSPSDVKNYIGLKIGNAEREHFMVVFLNAQNRIIKGDILFSGTLTQTSVYPREIIKSALACNAASIVLAHNHPSGSCMPSKADEHLTETIKKTCELVDIRVLDHIIVGATSAYSFAEHGLI